MINGPHQPLYLQKTAKKEWKEKSEQIDSSREICRKNQIECLLVHEKYYDYQKLSIYHQNRSSKSTIKFSVWKYSQNSYNHLHQK